MDCPEAAQELQQIIEQTTGKTVEVEMILADQKKTVRCRRFPWTACWRRRFICRSIMKMMTSRRNLSNRRKRTMAKEEDFREECLET